MLASNRMLKRMPLVDKSMQFPGVYYRKLFKSASLFEINK